MAVETQKEKRLLRHSCDSLVEDLRALGVKEGQTVLVRGDLGAVGRTAGRPGETILEALLRAVGPTGTLLGLAFTRTYFLPFIKNDACFELSTPPITGALAKVMLGHPRALRSLHPTSSFVAIGEKAFDFVSNHDASKPCFSPMQRLIDDAGLQLVFGCVASSPGFTTAHWAQHSLGLSRRFLICGLTGSYYFEDGQKKLYRRWDFGGCSRGFGKFYAPYVEHEILKTGYFGGAYAISAQADKAFKVEIELLRTNPRFALCDDPVCISCRLLCAYNKREAVPYMCARFFRAVKAPFARLALSRR